VHDHTAADDVEVRAAPVLPVDDLDRALGHYRALGFLVSRYDDGYGYAAWRGLELHLAVSAGHDPDGHGAVVFLHVPDADEVAGRWRAAGVGSTTLPTDRPWRQREGTHVDPWGNVLRFGSPLRSGG
jgi:catechol 2,3-dioxygenase-like lactoylglutathione lyase family enzyme